MFTDLQSWSFDGLLLVAHRHCSSVGARTATSVMLEVQAAKRIEYLEEREVGKLRAEMSHRLHARYQIVAEQPGD